MGLYIAFFVKSLFRNTRSALLFVSLIDWDHEATLR